ncbi:hypothetical protein JCM6882_009493 [Rhodosporidiobolus microsporus]
MDNDAAPPTPPPRAPSVPLVHPQTANGVLDSSSLPTEPTPGLPTPEEILADPERKQLSDEKNEVKVEKLSNGLVVKRGKRLAVELVAIDYMREHLMKEDGEMVIPVTRYRGFYRSDDIDYLFLTHVPGLSLESQWPSLSPSTRSSVLTQLATILRTLRSFTAPYIGRLNETQSFQVPWRPSAPYRTREEYLRGLRAAAPVEASRWETGGDLASLLEPPTTASEDDDRPLGVLTHGDVSARNILVDPSLPPGHQIVGIIDWECLEFCPPEMEYLRTRRELEKGWSKEEEAAREILKVVEEVSGVEGERLEKSWEWYKEMVM